MELLEVIETRRSFRGFKSTPIPREVMEKILKAAGNSPSYTNTQPWEVAVVCGKKKDELSKIIYDLASAKVPTNPDLPLPATWPPEMEERSKEHGARRLKVLGVEREDKEGREKLTLMNYEFYGAPCAMFLFADRALGSWSIFDMGLFAQNLILAAHAFGVESCLQASVTNYPDAIREFLGVPKTRQLIIGISIGYPDPEAKLNAYRSIKQKPDEFTKWYA
ncbi:nitroreductase [Chloroflexota bacterium]